MNNRSLPRMMFLLETDGILKRVVEEGLRKVPFIFVDRLKRN